MDNKRPIHETEFPKNRFKKPKPDEDLPSPAKWLMQHLELDKQIWKVRRRIVFGYMFFFALITSFVVIWSDPNQAIANIIMAGISLCGFIGVIYITSAAYSDHKTINGNGGVEKNRLATARKIWRIRRRLVASFLIYFAALIVYVVIEGNPTDPVTNIIIAGISASGLLSAAHITSEVWVDRSCAAKKIHKNKEKGE